MTATGCQRTHMCTRQWAALYDAPACVMSPRIMSISPRFSLRGVGFSVRPFGCSDGTGLGTWAPTLGTDARCTINKEQTKIVEGVTQPSTRLGHHRCWWESPLLVIIVSAACFPPAS